MSNPTISGYTIVERIGSGGFASVYRATEDGSGTQWAIKVLHDHTSGADEVRRFERERTTMRALSGHPHIVGVQDDGQTKDGRHYTVLEYVGGGSVRDLLARNGALHWSEVLPIAVQICAALDVAHRNGVLHRDVKPANILLQDDTAKLTDFGIARLVGQSQVTAAQSIVGTLAYTPPEIFHNTPFDGRGDIYQLGVTMYEMLLGRAPFTSAAADNKAAVIRRILENPAPPLAQFDVPQPVSDLLDDVLAKDAADRPQSAATLIDRINAVEVELGRPATRPHDDHTLSMAATLPTLDASSSAPTPPPPIIEPPTDVDQTVVDQMPMDATRSIAAEAPPQSEPWDVLDAPAEQPAPTPDPSPVPEAEGRPRRGVWIGAVAVLLLALGGGIIGAQFANQGDDTPDDGDTVTDVDGDTNDEDNDDSGDTDVDAPPAELQALDNEAFAAPGGSDGIIFGSAANSFGLTMVGAAGDGENVRSQAAHMWTLGPVDDELTIVHRPSFGRDDADTAQQRLWGIGVIDNEQFLVVGETAAGSSTDGLAWVGDRMGNFTRLTDTSFTGSDIDALRGATDDGDDGFLVAGRRTDGSASVPGLWRVSNETGDWTEASWTVIDVGSGATGVLNDVITSGSIAVAVGEEGGAGIVKTRRGTNWSDLISPIPDARFWGVTVSGDRIIAVGELNEATPFAIIANVDGEGSVHNLPIRADIGVARDVTTRSNGDVIVVGDADWTSQPNDEDVFDRDGAVWQLIPGADDAANFNADRWTTRASADLRQSGFVEFWTIDEFEDRLYVFGRTNDGDTEPAGAWTLDLQ